MEAVETTTEFEYSASCLRILIPGIFVTIISATTYLSYFKCFNILTLKSVWELLPIVTIFILISIFVGSIISVLLNPMTRLLEGYPLELNKKKKIVRSIRNILCKRQWKMFLKHKRKYDTAIANQNNVERNSAYSILYYYFSYCLYMKSSKRKIKDDDLKKGIFPTKFGNVFKSMEIYPKWKYGIDANFFWTRIELIMSEENRNVQEKNRAFVDMFVQLTWIFFFSAIIYLGILIYNKNFFTFIFLVLFIILSRFCYIMAVYSALNFGIYVRSIFDVYREELWKKIKYGQVNVLDSLPEKDKWNKIFENLYHF